MSSWFDLKTLGLASLFLTLVVASGACSDDGDGGPGSGTADMGGPRPGDMDGDEWPDEVDNCPSTLNFEQRDRDQDGVGDVCDVCPATPNGTDDECANVQEAEPNNELSEAQALTLVEVGRFRQVEGVIESPSLGTQSVDTFEFDADAGELLEVRAARTDSASSIQPVLEVTYAGSEPFAPRRAEGRFEAVRQLYIPRTGTYQIRVSDRRGFLGSRPVGGMNEAYVLSLRRLEPPNPQNASLPLENRSYTLEDPRELLFLEASFEGENFALLSTETAFGSGAETFGLDTILVVELADGTVLENDDVGRGLTDSRVTVEGPPEGTVRIIVDHKNFTGLLDGRLYSVEVFAEEFDRLPEIEPNDDAEFAAELQYPEERGGDPTDTEALIDVVDPEGPDFDVFTFEGNQGDFVRIDVQGASAMEPFVILFVRDGDSDRVLATTQGFSQAAVATMRLVLPETRPYFLFVSHAGNVGDEPEGAGGPSYRYTITVDRRRSLDFLDFISSSQELLGQFTLDGQLRAYGLLPSGPSVVDIEATRPPTSATVNPVLEIFDFEVSPDDGAVLPTERIGFGEQRVVAYLDRASNADPFPLTVYNGNDFRGGPGLTFGLDVRLDPATAQEEGEPNDSAMQATDLGGDFPVVVNGAVAANEPDWFSLDLTAGQSVSIFGNGPAPSLFALLNPSGVVVATGSGLIQRYTPTVSGSHDLQVVSGPQPSTYTLIVVED